MVEDGARCYYHHSDKGLFFEWVRRFGVEEGSQMSGFQQLRTSRLESCSSISSALAKQEVFLWVPRILEEPRTAAANPASLQREESDSRLFA